MAYSLSKNHVHSIKTSIQFPQIKTHTNVISRFFEWCEKQESNRFLWLGLTFFAQIGLTVPLTAYSILFFGGNNFLLCIILCAVNVPVLVLNLAALPAKTTLPVLFFAWLAQAILILFCVSGFFIQ